MLVSFVIPTRNRGPLLEQTVRSIWRQQAACDTEIIIVDNGSTDDTEQRVARLIAEGGSALTYHRMVTNGGPARSRNWGAARASGQFIAFVDSDVELRAGWLLHILDAFEQHADVGIVTGKLVFACNPAVVHCFGGQLSRIGLGWDANQGEDANSLQEARYRLWAPSASLVVRRAVFQELGGFDDAFFYGYEDSDLGWRFNLAGWRCLCLPDAVADHATTERVDEGMAKVGQEIVFHYCKNRLRSMLKNYGAGNLVRRLPLYFAYSCLDALLRSPRSARLRALVWSAAELPATLRLRKSVQRTRKVSDSALQHLFSSSLFPATSLRNRMKLLQPIHGPAPRAAGRGQGA